jgi:hypothetical protein
MRLFFALALAPLAVAQSPDLSGVWKGDLAASQFPGGHPPSQYLEIISQAGPKITEQTGSWFPFGVSRTEMVFTTDGVPIIEKYAGVPSRETAEPKDGKLTLTIETDGQPDTTTRTYDLSADGQKLTISIHATHDGHEMQTQLVLLKQPDAAGAPLREPPPAATATYKNLKTSLKELDSEQFIDTMHYFAWALNKNCEFCHVQRDFKSDDKKEKRTAREMISMTAGINRDTFHGKQEVSCFTCHSFREHPQSRPLFPGEKPHKEEAEKGE